MSEEKIRKLEDRLTLLRERREMAEATLARQIRRAEQRLEEERLRLTTMKGDLSRLQAELMGAAAS